MKIWALLAFFVIGLLPVIASDPPGYARALIGRVSKIVPEGVVVDGIKQNQLHLVTPFPAGVDHECFAGIGGTSLVRGLKTPYRVGDKIEIMVTLTDDNYLLTLDSAQQVQVGICNALSESLAFPVNVDWNPSTTASTAAPVPPTPAALPLASPSPDWSTGSLNDPIPGTHK
jgi:hypothetical protein